MLSIPEDHCGTQFYSRNRKPKLKLIFDEPQTALNVINAGFFMQNALSLICGMSFKANPLVLKGYFDNEPASCEVHISGQHWLIDRYLTNGMTQIGLVETEALVVRLFKNMESLSDDIIVFLDQLKKGAQAEDIIFWSMPALERGLFRKFLSNQEISYMDAESAFWQLIDNSNDEKVQIFCRKHLKVVAAKKPSPEMLLHRAIEEFENEGVVFPDRAAKKIWRARNKLMHGAAVDLTSAELGEAADLTRTLGILILLKNMGLRGENYAAGIRVVSASCTAKVTA